MTELATEAAELLPQVAAGSTTRMIPFAEHVRFEADTGEVEFEESSDLSIVVAERVLPSWARAARLTCVRAAGDSLESADGGLVVVAQERRGRGGRATVRRSHRRGVGGQALSAGRRSVEPGQ